MWRRTFIIYSSTKPINGLFLIYHKLMIANKVTNFKSKFFIFKMISRHVKVARKKPFKGTQIKGNYNTKIQINIPKMHSFTQIENPRGQAELSLFSKFFAVMD